MAFLSYESHLNLKKGRFVDLEIKDVKFGCDNVSARQIIVIDSSISPISKPSAFPKT